MKEGHVDHEVAAEEEADSKLALDRAGWEMPVPGKYSREGGAFSACVVCIFGTDRRGK